MKIKKSYLNNLVDRIIFIEEDQETLQNRLEELERRIAAFGNDSTYPVRPPVINLTHTCWSCSRTISTSEAHVCSIKVDQHGKSS